MKEDKRKPHRYSLSDIEDECIRRFSYQYSKKTRELVTKYINEDLFEDLFMYNSILLLA